ncbi:MAG: succinate dehydrogenase assembly factor 2 [Methylobacteriaceae bacterium]|nr:succinate dehydrogenase assembly factor 2 [Methylobacteriaceae bacterium]
MHEGTGPEPKGEGDALDPRRKRARFRAWHRGTRELDLIMGRFADREIATLPEAELDLFEALLEEAEPDVFAWVTGTKPAPDRFAGPLIERLATFSDLNR